MALSGDDAGLEFIMKAVEMGDIGAIEYLEENLLVPGPYNE